MTRTFLPFALAIALVASACSGDGLGRGQRGVSEGAQVADDIPGQSVDGFAPGVDDRVAIIGVEAGATMPMHLFPESDSVIVEEIPADASELFGFGQAHESPDGSIWWLIRYANAQGWIVPGAAYLGRSNDVSVVIAGTLGQATYGSPGALIDDAASRYDNPLIVSDGSSGDSGALVAIIDSLNDSSPSDAGERLILTIANDDGSYRLTEAELVSLCARGVTEDGTCT